MNLKITVPENWDPNCRKALSKWYQKLGRHKAKMYLLTPLPLKNKK